MPGQINLNNLCRRGEIALKSELFGNSFEHFIVLEVRAYNSYLRKNEPLQYWRSVSKYKVDLIIGGKIAIEIKGTSLVHDKHLKGLRALKEEKMMKKYICVSLDSSTRLTSDGIEILPWPEFLKKLWAQDLF